MRALLLIPLAFLATAASSAEVLTATRTIRPGEVIAPADLGFIAAEAPAALVLPEQAVGLAARRLLVPGRPIMAGDVGAPALVKRNGPVALVYEKGGLTIRAEGRALADGAEGDLIRVMNLASRQTVTGTVTPEGHVDVGGWR
jgi:flagella basal body P-ring formation protein FlgA